MTTHDDIVMASAHFSRSAPVEEKRVGYPRCEHIHTLLDEVERRVRCRDCYASLDPYDALVQMSRQWHRWMHEADQLRALRAEYQDREREKWERAVTRHLNANPLHRAEFRVRTDGGWQSRLGQQCRTCIRLERSYRVSWGPASLRIIEPPAVP